MECKAFGAEWQTHTHTEHSLIKIKKIYKKYVYVNDELIAAVVALKHNVRDNKLVIAY